MNDNKVPGIWKWSVLLLVLCNVGLLLTLWLKPHWGGGPQHGGPRDYVIQNLKFTDEQVKKYDELIKDHRKSMDQLRKDAMEYRRLLFTNLKNEHGGLNTDSLAQLIANNQKQVEVVTYTHFGQVRAMCNDAQKTEFDKIITDVIKKMNGGPPPRPDDGQRPLPGQPEEGGQPPRDEQGPPPGPGQNP